ncbi:MAG: hypothetical protein A3F13_02080 [Gammaproteobacteria bacterium RIFCSPHIGHO2_12_FULL_40_19]|nr:MAG: hypothetical protein A3F13_02080 [Gammaproteobacteria bacterium RIFCSPHIGHO2_12_FULL_40_19]
MRRVSRTAPFFLDARLFKALGFSWGALSTLPGRTDTPQKQVALQTPVALQEQVHFLANNIPSSKQDSNGKLMGAIFFVLVGLLMSVKKSRCYAQDKMLFDYRKDPTFQGNNLTFDQIATQLRDQVNRRFPEYPLSDFQEISCFTMVSAIGVAHASGVLSNLRALTSHPAFPLILAYAIDTILLSNKKWQETGSNNSSYCCNKVLLFVFDQIFTSELRARKEFFEQIKLPAQVVSIQPIKKESRVSARSEGFPSNIKTKGGWIIRCAEWFDRRVKNPKLLRQMDLKLQRRPLASVLDEHGSILPCFYPAQPTRSPASLEKNTCFGPKP